MKRRQFIQTAAAGALALSVAERALAQDGAAAQRPNVLFCLADDWSWAHAGAYGDKGILTPTFDRLAREGALFQNAFCSAPTCTPSRGSLLTGQDFFRLETGANLWGVLPKEFAVYPDLLEEAGYHVGMTRKGWGPGDWKVSGRTRNPAGPDFKDFDTFLGARPDNSPFCFWFGSREPHRPYQKGSGLAAGKKLEDAMVPPFLPDTPIVRSDILDYYLEVELFDREVGEMLATLEARGELDNTLVVMTSDNGMPFPRAKANLYDYGTQMPLAIRWPGHVASGRTIDDFVSFIDFAPTFLEAAGLQTLPAMTGSSLMPLLTSKQNGHINPARDAVICGRERHVRLYPCRSIRTEEHLLIHNYQPSAINKDIDASPTLALLDKPEYALFREMSLAPRPELELYEVKKDPAQLNNLADNPAHTTTLRQLDERLTRTLIERRDPRALGNGEFFDTAPTTRPQQPSE